MPKTPTEEPKEPKESKEPKEIKELKSKPDAPKSKPENSVPRRYVEKTAQSLIRWSPLGGTMGLLGHAVLSQDWLMAIVLFPASVVCAVWANYTEGFVEKIGEIARGRGTNDAEGLVKWGLAANEALKWQLSGFEQKYLQYQSIRCGGYETEGFNPGEFLPVTLKDVFVPLTISPNSFSDLEKLGKNKPDREALELNIWELLAGTSQQPALKQMAILAPGGYGKTTLMRHITYTYARGTQGHYKAPKLVPILLYLRKLKEIIATKQPTLPELITDYYLKDLLKGKDLAIPPNWARNILKLGKALILFDGFDEVDQKWRGVVSEWISDQMQYYDKSVFILTSRPRGYDGYTAEKPKTQLRVLQFNSQQRKEFITKWYFAQENMFPNRDRNLAKDAAERGSISLIEQIENQPELATMARIPLLLNMIAFYHRESVSSQELPTYRTGLYKEICNVQLIKRADPRLPDFPLDALERQQVLQGLALWMMEQNLERLEKEQLLQVLQPKVKAFDGSVDVKDFVDAIADVSELLVEAEKDEYEFAHLTFQAFLAAAEILHLKQEDFLVEQWQDDWWKDTMLFYTGLVKNPSGFLRKLLDKGEEAVSLADACRKNTSKKIDPSIEAQLRGIDTQIGKLRYEKLEGFLKNGQWREADKETVRVMLEVVGKEKDDYFTREELLNFPCEDLLKIDKLWLEYSKINGVSKFGFSLQKEIIKKCGYKLDGSDPPSKVWYDFLDEVGWRDKKTEEWQDPTYTLDINTKIEGTLPTSLQGWCNLFSRIETCRL